MHFPNYKTNHNEKVQQPFSQRITLRPTEQPILKIYCLEIGDFKSPSTVVTNLWHACSKWHG